MLDLPKACTVKKFIPKSLFYKKVTMATSVKKEFTDVIEKITWLYKIAPDTLGVNKTSINIIYISIAFLEALIVVIISSLLCLFLNPTLNSLLYNKSNINIIQPNFIISLLVLLLTILIILLSLIIPLIKLNKKTPIQIINEGKRKWF